jgi:exosortase A
MSAVTTSLLAGADTRQTWPPAAVASIVAALAAVVVIHHATLADKAALWWRSQTYAHGFLVAPVSAWLVWRRRHVLAHVPPMPSSAAMGLLALLGAGWLLGAVADVPSLQQYMVVAMLGATAAAIAGVASARVLAFPLGYLLLAVPFGEALVTPLIHFTAAFTVSALQLSGVPVLRENNYLTLPNGNWSIVDACSGLRYVIASVALGFLYAGLNYRTATRRLAFVAVSMLLPVLANGVRAYFIVLLGYVSDMRLAVGIDHLIYGWLFFGIVCLLLFGIGRWWREPVPAPASRRDRAPVPRPAPPADPRPAWPAALVCIAITAGWPLLAWAMRAPAPATGTVRPLALAAAPPPWRPADWEADTWRLPRAATASPYAAAFADGTTRVTLQLAWYERQRRGAESLTAGALPHQPEQSVWYASVATTREVALGARRFSVEQTELRDGARRLLVWRWYRQDGADTASPVVVKLLLAKSRLLRRRESGAVIAVATACDDTPDAAAAVLERFLRAMLPAIDQGLRHAGQ